MNLFILHCRGATVYAAKPNCAEAECNANEFIHFALPRRNSICGAAELRRSREQCKCSILPEWLRKGGEEKLPILAGNLYIPEFDTLCSQKEVQIEATDRCNGDL